MTQRHLLTTTAVGVLCTLAGATAGIAGSSASTHQTRTPDSTAVRWSASFGPTIARDLDVGSFDAIHSVSVEPNGDRGFQILTVNAGTISAVRANSLTVKEGTTDATYATPTITPHGAVKVTLDGKTTTLSALEVGDLVFIAQSSSGTSQVIALDRSSGSSPWNGSSDGWGPGATSANWGPGSTGSGWSGYGPGGAGWW